MSKANEMTIGVTRYRLTAVQARNVKPGDLLVTDHLYKVHSFPKVQRVITFKDSDSVNGKKTRLETNEWGDGPKTDHKVTFAVLRPLGFANS